MFIQFGKLNLKLLIPILFPFFLKFRRLNRRNHNINSTAFAQYCNFISLIPCIILYFIQKFKSKSEKIKKKQIINPIIFINNEEKDNLDNKQNTCDVIEMNEKIISRKIKIKQFFYISLISFLQLCASTMKVFFYNKINRALKTNIQPLFQLMFLIIFCMIFLGFSIFYHQIVSAIIISCCLIIFFVESVVYQNVSLKDAIYSLLFYFFLQAFYIISDVIGKKYLNTYVENLFLFLFKYCIICLIAMSLYGLSTYIFNIDQENYQIFQVFPKIEIWIFFVDLFFGFLYEIGMWLTIYYFNPSYYFIFETIADFLELILSKFDKTSTDYSTEQLITFYILYPIIIFFICIFNEIIIVNIFNLSYYTKLKTMERAIEDANILEKPDRCEDESSIGMINIGEDHQFFDEQN